MPVVYITNFSAHDYSAASRYGSIKPVSVGIVNLLNPDRLITQAIEETKGSSEEDYLLFSGPPVMCALCLIVWLSKHESCNILIFDAKEREYVARKISNTQVLTAVESIEES